MANNIYLQSPNGSFWVLVASDLGDMNLSPAVVNPLRFLNPCLTIAGVNWQFSAANNGGIQMTQVKKAPYLLPYLVVKSSPSNILYQFQVNEFGQFLTTANPAAVDFIPGPVQSQYLQRGVTCFTAANQPGVVMADESVWCSAVNTFVPWVETNAHQIVISEIS